MLTCSRSGAEQLYLHVEYREDEENEMCYVFSVWTGRDVDCASKHKANLKIGNIGNEMTTVVNSLLISSVENVPSSDENAKYFFWLPWANVMDDQTFIAILTIERCDK